MINNVANNIALKMIAKNTIEKSEKEMYVYGLELLIQKTILNLIILIISLLTNSLIVSIIYIHLLNIKTIYWRISFEDS